MTDENETLVAPDEAEIETPDSELETALDDGADVEVDAGDAEGEDLDGEVVVTIGDAKPEDDDEDDGPDDGTTPDWVKKARQKNKEYRREARDARAERDEYKAKLKAEIAASAEKGEMLKPLPKKPAFEDSYETDTFDKDLTSWYELKQKHDAAAREREAEEKSLTNAYQARTDLYKQHKAKLNVGDYEEAEAATITALSAAQQTVIVKGAKNSALVVYALGKNPAKAKELASIADPIEFAFAVANLESELKVSKRKPRTTPATRVETSGNTGGMGDTHLEKLREAAAKSGDMSEVHAFKREQRRKGAAR